MPRVGFLQRSHRSQPFEFQIELGPSGMIATLRVAIDGTIDIRGHDAAAHVSAKGDDSYSAFLEAQSRLANGWLRSCGNCVHFVFSEMSAQMSGGRTGYCGIDRSSPEQSTHEDRVSIFDICQAFDFGPAPWR